MRIIFISIFLALFMVVFTISALEWDYSNEYIQYSIIRHNEGEIFILQIDPAYFTLELNYNSGRVYIDEIMEEDFIFAINAGFFFTEKDNSGIPVGMVKINDKIKGNLNDRYPFFYIKDNVPGISNSSAWILRNRDSIDMLFQSGPILVWNNQKRGIFGNRLSERSAIGITADNNLIFCITKNTYLSLSELSGILMEFNCSRAINLDGSGSSQGYFRYKEFEWNSYGYYKIPTYIYIKRK